MLQAWPSQGNIGEDRTYEILRELGGSLSQSEAQLGLGRSPEVALEGSVQRVL